MSILKSEELHALTDRIIEGYRLKQTDPEVQDLLTQPLAELQKEAGRLQTHFCGNHVDFCTIINARSAAAAKTANTAPRPPAITPAVKNTGSWTKRKS